MRKKFEYRKLSNATDHDLAKCGEEGWELVSVIFIHGSHTNLSTGNQYFYFKREVPEQIGIH